MASEETQVVARRGVLRGGAIAAGVAAGAVIAGASATRASAAVGDPVTVGGTFTANNQATSLTVTNSTTNPALRLINTTGPALRLDPITAEEPGVLAVGSIAGGEQGPWVGVNDESGSPFTTYLATGVDLAMLPVPVALPPTRILDTRTASGLDYVVAASNGAFDSSSRLKDGAWVDIAVDSAAADFTVEAAFLNITVTGPLTGGFVTACPGGKPRPTASTLNFTKGQTIANGAFIGLDVVQDAFAVRLYARATTHLIVDLTGLSVNGLPGPAAAAAVATKANRTTAKTRPAARLVRVRARKQR